MKEGWKMTIGIIILAFLAGVCFGALLVAAIATDGR